jgi:Rrf2 family protein
MRISSKAEYGVLALVDLALHRDSGPTKIREIADRRNIPKKYLEQVLLDLKRGGIVGSNRGKNGGYYLDRDPEDITLMQVLEILEEQTSLVESDRDRPTFLQQFWDEQYEKLREQLSIPLSEILKRKEESEKEVMYHI